jgi:hypothetical protein
MSFEKQRKLMDVLYQRTQRGEIEWQEGLTDVFQVSFKNNSVQLHSYRNAKNDNDVDYLVFLINGDGEIADRFTDEDLDLDESGMPGNRWYGMLGDMYRLARRRARGGDKVLDDILQELDGDDVPF